MRTYYLKTRNCFISIRGKSLQSIRVARLAMLSLRQYLCPTTSPESNSRTIQRLASLDRQKNSSKHNNHDQTSHIQRRIKLTQQPRSVNLHLISSRWVVVLSRRQKCSSRLWAGMASRSLPAQLTLESQLSPTNRGREAYREATKSKPMLEERRLLGDIKLLLSRKLS